MDIIIAKVVIIMDIGFIISTTMSVMVIIMELIIAIKIAIIKVIANQIIAS